jgi:hypothetical protein
MPHPTRREFLKTTAVAGAVLTVGDLAFGAAPPTAAPASAPAAPPLPSWLDRPMRWAQLTLVEDDPEPGKFDLAFWLDYFARTRSDAVCLSAGGCVAYYPTEVPGHHRSRWLGDRDVFGELVTGCRKLGMVVVARTDPHATYDDVQAAHPDWIAVTADGKPRRHWASPDLWVTCGLGPYNFEFMTEVKREIMSRYHIDGIFINRWDGSGQCFCEHCRKNFRDATGFELPREEDPQQPARQAYIRWRQERLFELWRKWDGAVRAINPDSCVIPNTGGGASSSLDMVRIGSLAPMLVADRQARRGLMPPWANGKNGKEFRATMRHKPVIGLFSVGLEEPYRWKDSVQRAEEVKLWAVDGIANGLRPWFSKFSGAIHDPRWMAPVAELYEWCATHESYLRNEESLARVALVYSQQTAWFHRPRYGAPNHTENAALGWYHALVESRVPFDMVHDRLLDPAHLEGIDTLILPNIAALSDAQCAQLHDFVERGGAVIATYETALYDELGRKRNDFGLAGLFGVSFRGTVEGPMHNAYLELRHDRARGHPLLAGLADAPRTIHGVWRLDVSPHAEFAPAPLTLIPSYPDLPMERVYPRRPHTDIAQVFLRQVGQGRVAYFPWDIDRTFWEILDADHGMLLRNTVAWSARQPPPVSVSGPGLLDVTFWRQQRSFTVHLVNLTNPMMMKGPVREIIPVGAQRVSVRLPAGVQAKSVRLLVASATAPFRQDGNIVETTVPSVALHEVVAIDV